MPDDETSEQQAQASAAVEAQTEAVQIAAEANLRSIEAADEAEAAIESVIAVSTITADEINELRARISALEERVTNDERNDRTEPSGNTHSGSGLSSPGDATESAPEEKDEGRDRSPIIWHWWFGRR